MKVIQFSSLLVPTQLGSVTIQILGLGDDGLVYAWDSPTGQWMLLKAEQKPKPELKK